MEEYHFSTPRQCGKSNLFQDVFSWQQSVNDLNESLAHYDPSRGRTKLTFYYTNGKTYTATSVLDYNLNFTFGRYSYSRVKNSMITENVRVPTHDILAIEIQKPSGSVEILRNPDFDVVVNIGVCTVRQKIKRHNRIQGVGSAILKTCRDTRLAVRKVIAHRDKK
jgi:hypothetical protein